MQSLAMLSLKLLRQFQMQLTMLAFKRMEVVAIPALCDYACLVQMKKRYCNINNINNI